MRILLLCRYDGSCYQGSQIQPNGKTIQEQIEKALKKIHKKEVRVSFSGRTDSGVHAYCQPLHFDTDLTIPAQSWTRALNANLPKNIRILDALQVADDFHVRYDSIGKTYHYKLYLGREVDPLLLNYVGHESYNFDFERAEKCLKYFLGEHDFSSFCSKNSSVENKVRTIYDFKIERDISNKNIINFEISGNGFLYNMVRIIIGTITEVAIGKYEPEYIQEILEKKERRFAGKRADASGLYMKCVYYENIDINNFIKNNV